MAVAGINVRRVTPVHCHEGEEAVVRRNAGGPGASTAAVSGEVLRHFREAAMLTQEQLASRIPCDRSHIARVEAGTRVPQDTFAKACDELLGTGGVLARLWGADRLVSAGGASGLVPAAGRGGRAGGGVA